MDINSFPQVSINSVQGFPGINFIDTDFAIFNNISELPISGFPHRVDASILAVGLEGECRLSVNLKEYDFVPGAMLLTLPDQIVQVQNVSKDFSGIFIAVSKEFIDDAFSKMKELLSFFFCVKEHPCILLEKNELECIMEYHSFLWKKVKMQDHVFRKQVAQGLLQALFYDIYNIFHRHIPCEIKPKSRKEELVEKFLREIYEHYREERTVTFYANRLCLTPKHLSGVVKEVSGKTASEWIDSFVILEAKAMLKSSEMNIQEIAEALHFANQSFFGKYFKHYVGISPKEYRRK